MKFSIATRFAASASILIACFATASPAADSPKRIEITAKRFSYSPSEVTVKKGEPVVLVFRSEDVPHGIKFKDLNLQTEIGKSAPNQLSFTPTQAGDFVGHCSHFCGTGHGSMTLTLHVTE
jgi:cytochrome c oxidase subunit 2